MPRVAGGSTVIREAIFELTPVEVIVVLNALDRYIGQLEAESDSEGACTGAAVIRKRALTTRRRIHLQTQQAVAEMQRWRAGQGAGQVESADAGTGADADAT